MLATTGDQDSSLTPSGQEWLGTTGTQQPLPAGTSLRGRSGGIRSNLSLRLAVGCADSGWTGGKVHRLDGPPNPREGARSGTANVATPTNQLPSSSPFRSCYWSMSFHGWRARASRSVRGVVTLFWHARKAAELRRPTAAVDSAVGRIRPAGWEHRVDRPEMRVLPAEGTSGIA